ncbi:MAG: hypothetical protein CENE_02645 [Candidatus Celerinatantimonas neptuna]|nr:MAG: hypothetical protein CENE_02645 [Candidatus Celerinatantimonas neptuna]
MFNDPIEAWHDAFCSIRSRTGNGSSGITWDVIQGELAKVKHTVLALPSKQLDIGMVMFAPDDAQGNYLSRVEQFIYRCLLDLKPERSNSLKQIRRLSMLVDALIIRCRREMNDHDSKITDVEIAASLGIFPSAYNRDYQSDANFVMEQLKCYAGDALVEVSITCNKIKKGYYQSDNQSVRMDNK